MEWRKVLGDEMQGLKQRDVAVVKEVLPKVLDALKGDITILDQGLQEASNYFEKKSRQTNCPKETLKEANWGVLEFQILLQQSQDLHRHLVNTLASLADVSQAVYVLAVIHHLAASSFIYLRKFFKKKRTAATHVLVLMLSDEKRSKKPYAIPVRYVPCRTLNDLYIRDLTRNLKEEMKKRDLSLTGKPLRICLLSS